MANTTIRPRTNKEAPLAAEKTRAKQKRGAGSERGSNPRGLWSGSISFGLLQIPITLVTAEQRDDEIHFRQLDKHDLSPIKYERVSSKTSKPVEWGDIVKGYEIEPETFVVLEPAELAKAAPKATQTVDIQDFVRADLIHPTFFETPYYVVPQKRAGKAYVLLREALKAKKAVAIASFVLRTREHLCALMPVDDAIVLEVLRFGHELRDSRDLTFPRGDDVVANAREVAMAEQLVEGMMTEWEPRKYKDRFHAEVMNMIEEKAKTGEVKIRRSSPAGEDTTNVVDLLDLLTRSVAGFQKNPKSAASGTNDEAAADGRDQTSNRKKSNSPKKRPSKKEAA